MVLANMQYELDGLVFGRGTDYLVQGVQFSEPTTETTDYPRPREDGIAFGPDLLRGMTILFDIVMNKYVSTEIEGLEALDSIVSAWSGDEIRKLPGEVTTLKMNRFGRQTRVYGRPRHFASVLGRVGVGWVPITADFQCVDHLFYAETEEANTVQIVPADTGGILFPLAFPMTTAGIGEKAGEIAVGGNRPTWLTATITGPITNPEVDVLGLWKAKLLTTIADGQTVTIDPRPWSRGILRDGVANVAGTLTYESPKMSDMVVPPGNQQIVLRGTDVTGTATMTIRWRNAYRMT